MNKPTQIFKHPRDAVNEFVRQLNDELADQLKVLLETKHLYQNIVIDPNSIREAILARVYSNDRETVERRIDRLLGNRLTLTAGSGLSLISVDGGVETVEPCLVIKNVRLFCSTCDERNVFSPVWLTDVSNELLKPSRLGTIEEEIRVDLSKNQLIFLALQCQHCKGVPEGFLLRRDGWKVSLDGRSPMEQINLPAYIPKPEAHLFRDAMIAWHAGKFLAAVFYLRAFIEQFARRQTAIKDKRTGDEIMEAYAGTLPGDTRSHLPSFKEWYDKLSAPIHTTDEGAAEALFDSARDAIERHFDIRRVFKIPEK